MCKKLLYLMTFVVLLGLLAAPSIATTYYVDQDHGNADDDNAGTSESAPWETLTKACETVVAGDTVYVKAGTYVDSVNNRPFAIQNNGTAANPITFISSPPRAAVVRSSSLPSSRNRYAWSFKGGSQYIIVDGFKIEGGIVVAYDRATYCTIRNCEVLYGWCASDPTLNWGITLYWSDYCVVENCYVHDMTSSGSGSRNTAGIMLLGDPDNSDGKDVCEYNIFQGNTVDTGGNVRNAFGIKAGYLNNNTWRYNVALNSSVGFHTMGSTGSNWNSSYNTYYQNIAIDCGRAFDAGYAVDHTYIYNNTAVDCDSFYSAQNNNVTETELWNNILQGTNDTVIDWDGYPTAMPFTTLIDYSNYNCFYNFNKFAYREKMPSLNYYTLSAWQTATGYDDDTITSDPNLVGSGDYSLDTGSPCINAGVDLQDYDDDENTTESINMGAYITGNETIGHDWGATAPSKATSPNPANSATGVSITADLSWTEGSGSTSSDVYFGTDSTPDSGELQGNQTATTFDPGTMSNNTTYYWRIDEINGEGTTTGDVWSFTTETEVSAPGAASSPSPANSATDVSTTADLSWTAGSGATSRDVYFGTSSPGTSQGNQTATTFDTGTMDANTTYYWRIDEVNSAGTTTGTVWSFTTATAGTGAFQQDSGTDGIVSMEAENYDANTSQGSHDWISVTTPTGYTGTAAMNTIPNNSTNQNTGYAANSPRLDFEVDFVKTGTHYVWIRGYGASGSDDSCHAGLDGSEISTCDRISTFSTSYTWSKATMDSVDATFSVSSTGVQTVNVWMREDGFVFDKIVLTTNASYAPTGNGPAESSRGGGPTPPGQASNPSPANSATGVSITADLSWTAGSGATSRDVYFGTTSPGASQGNQTATTFDTSTMTNNTTYYWRIDEVNAQGTTTGTVWSFTTIVAAPGQASSPSPSNSATGVSITADLSWTEGSGATSHDVYFGTTSPGTSQGNQTATTFDTGTMSNNTTYYWRIDEVNAGGTTTGTVWSFTTIVAAPGAASSPSPANSATGVSITTNLSWTAGSGATSRDVYFGTSSPGASQGNQTATTFDTGTMSNNTTYYWRIDEVNPGGTTTGTVWSFTTIVAAPGAASSPSPANSATDVSINADLSWSAGSGATSHDVYFGTSSPGSFQGNQTATTFDTGAMANSTTYYWRIDEVNANGTTTGNVWSFTTIVAAPGQASSPTPANSATGVSITADLSWTAGSGATSHDVYFGTTSPGSFQGNQTATTFDPGAMANDTTYYWRIDEINAGGTTTGAVWSFTTIVAVPGQASSPSPADTATDIAVSADLSWSAGSGATSRDVYFGTSSPGASQGNQTATTFDTGTMANDTTYYWRIDEINAGGTTTGTVWSFTSEQQVTPDANLVGWWRFENNADDSAGTNDGTIYGAVSSTGKIGQALSFDEVNDYVTVPDFDYTNSSDEFSLSFWFKISDVSESLYQYMYSHGNVTADNSLNVYFSETSEGAGGEELRTWITLGDSTDWYSVSDPDYVDGQWHLYTITVSSVDGTKIYVDANSILSNSNIKGASMNPTSSIYIGARNDLNVDRYYGNSSTNDGLLDDVRLYDRALSQGDISSLFTGGITIAHSPSPADSAVDVSITADLNWAPGDYADTHDVYLGTDANAVADANNSSDEFMDNVDVNNYDPGTLSYDTTYYWAIDEVNDTTTWAGDVWSFTTEEQQAPGQASSPSPSNSATDVSITADLSWTAGSGSTSSDVYFGTSSPGTFQGNQTATTFDTGTMDNDTTYYWRIDEINAGGTTTGTVWSFTTIVAAPGAASNPSPANSATDVSITADLSWTAGSGSTSSDVYFGTSSPGTFQGNQTATTFDTGTMDNDTTYYWRIDEINAGGTTTGTVWSFTTTAAGGPVTEEFGDAADTNYPGTIADTYNNSGYGGDDNWSTDTTLNTYTWPADTIANTTIIKWDLTDIPTDANVTEATLYLYQVDSSGDSSYDIGVHKITGVNPGITTCTWQTYDGTNSWTGGSDGGQSDIAAAEDTPSVNLTDDEYKTWDVTDMVADWVATPASNYGMLVNSDDDASVDSYRFFASTEDNDSSTRPKLIVTYSD